MYGDHKQSSTDKVRSHVFQSRYRAKIPTLKTKTAGTGIDLSLLPSSLRKHCQRANYQTFIWRHSHVQFPLLPSPVGNGWRFDGNSELQVECTDLDILPQKVIDILGEEGESSDVNFLEGTTEEVEEDDEIDNIFDVIHDEDDD